MAKRPAYCYSRIDRPPYTRKKYIKGGPDSKIRAFDLGSPGKDFAYQVSLISKERFQASHNALEAARIHVNRFLQTHIGRENYHFRICVYPHHFFRENKIMSGAGADRLQDGMRKAFGKPIGSAARIYPGTRLLMVRFNDWNQLKTVQGALNRGRHKFPGPSKIVIEKGVDSN